MSTAYRLRYALGPEAVKKYDTTALRNEFLIDDLMAEDAIKLTYTHYDRYIASRKPLKLETIDSLKASFFSERREMGIINVGANGSVEIADTSYEIGHKDARYISMGCKKVVFKSADSNYPAKFYLNS